MVTETARYKLAVHRLAGMISSLQIQEPGLERQATPITGKLPVGSDNPVAGDKNRNRIAVVGLSHCSERARLAYELGQFFIAPGFSI